MNTSHGPGDGEEYHRGGDPAHPDISDTLVSRLAQQDKVPWYSKPNLRFLYFVMVPACLGVEATTGFDASIVSGLQAVPSWLEYFQHPRSTSLGLMTSIYSLGAVAAIPFVPSAVDKTGRRFPILLGGLISIIGGILQGSALNFTTFMISRFILGVSNVFCIVAAASLIGELSHPKERAVLGCLFNGLYDLGAVVAAWAILRTFAMTSNWAWRIPSFLQIMPSLLQVIFVYYVPESPRWLISKGRGSEAYATLVKYHAEGDENSDFVRAEYSQIEATLRAEMKIAQASDSVLSTPGMRKRVLIATFIGMSVQLSGVSLISFYLVPILDTIGIHDNRTKLMINFARFSWSFVNGIFISFIVPRYPRRKMFLMCAISLFIIFAAWTAASAEYSHSKNKVSAQIVLALIFLYSPAYNIGLTALVFPFLVELFPFHVRTKGIAIYQGWTRISGFFSQFVNPIGIDAAGWRWYIVYCVWNAFQVVFVYFMFPETSGRTLEELTFMYEGDQEMLSQTEVEVLLDTGTYGTVEADSRRAGRSEQ